MNRVPEKNPPRQQNSQNNGFWRLEHKDVAAILSRRDLSWETARVYLALADLTLGYGNPKDTISIDQIGALAHTNHWHTDRALRKLHRAGLYGEKKLSTRRILRWVIWPKESAVSTEAGTKKRTSDSTKGGTNTILPVSTGEGTKVSTRVGTHQEKTSKKNSTPLLIPGADPLPAQPQKNAWALWVEVWREERPGQPGPARLGPDIRASKELAKVITDPSEMKDICRRFLHDPDPFLRKQGHALRLLPGRLAAYRTRHNDPTEQQVEEAIAG